MVAKKSAKKSTANNSDKSIKENQSSKDQSLTSSNNSNSIVAVKLNHDIVAKKAFELAQLKKNYNDYVWMFAEADLQLSKGMVSGFGPNKFVVEVDKSKIPKKIDEKLTKEAAKMIFNKKIKLEDLQWFIAERKVVLDTLK